MGRESSLLNSHSAAKRLGRAGASHEYSCWNCIFKFPPTLSLRLAFSRHFSTGTRDISSWREKGKIHWNFQDVWRCAWNIFLALHVQTSRFEWIFHLNSACLALWRDRQAEARASSSRESWEMCCDRCERRDTIWRAKAPAMMKMMVAAMICEITGKKTQHEESVSLFLFQVDVL